MILCNNLAETLRMNYCILDNITAVKQLLGKQDNSPERINSGISVVIKGFVLHFHFEVFLGVHQLAATSVWTTANMYAHHKLSKRVLDQGFKMVKPGLHEQI